MRNRLAGLAVLTTAFMLSGCLRFDADLNVQSSGLISGDFTLEISQEIAAFAGITSSEAFAEEIESGDLDETEALPTGEIDCSPVERTGAYAVTCTFKDVEFTDEGELWWVTTDEDSVTFHSRNESNSEDDSTDIFGDDFSLGSVNFEITMPGVITSVDGDFVTQTSDTTFRIESSLTDSYEVVVVSEKGSAGGFPSWLWFVLGIGAIAAAAFAALTLKRRKSNAASTQVSRVPIIDGSEPEPPATGSPSNPAEQ